MSFTDVLVLLKKIVIGLLLVLIPFLIFFSGLWLLKHYG